MSNDSKTTQNRRLGSVEKYVKNVSTKANTLFRIKPSGEYCFVIDGMEVSPQEINRMYPTDELLCHRQNSDPRNNWMSGIKSY